MLTRRTTQRQFLLRPDAETNNAYIYCLAVAAQRCNVDVILPYAASNHQHNNIFDRLGVYPQFMEHFHKLLARCMNAYRGRWENFWASEEPCATELVEPADVIAKLIYSAANPVKDGLVERAHHWPGVNGYRNFLSGKPLTARRPRFFFDPKGEMPETVTLELKIPPELGPADEVRRRVREGVEAIEREKAAERARTGARIVGRANVLRQSWKDSPTSTEPRRNLRPRFAAGDREARICALVRFREFLVAYRDSRERWLVGISAVFPTGTYWLRRFAAVPIAALN